MKEQSAQLQYVFDASKPTFINELTELWNYRELMLHLAWRDLTVAYKQSMFGAIWIVVGPLWSMLFYTIVFGQLIGVGSGDKTAYPIFAYSGLIIWNYFTSVLGGTATSIVSNKGLITKIYFPRLVFPIVEVITDLVQFLITFVILLFLMLYYHQALDWKIVFLPLFLLLATASGLAIGLWSAVFYVRFRDVGRMLAVIQQFLLYTAPVVYPITLVPDRWKTVYNINPLTIFVQGFRWALLGQTGIELNLVLIGSAISIVGVITGIAAFIRTQSTFADII